VRSSRTLSILSEDDIKATKNRVTKALNTAHLNTALYSKSQNRGKYNSYTPEQLTSCHRKWPIQCGQAPFTRQNFYSGGCPNVFVVDVETMYRLSTTCNIITFVRELTNRISYVARKSHEPHIKL